MFPYIKLFCMQEKTIQDEQKGSSGVGQLILAMLAEYVICKGVNNIVGIVLSPSGQQQQPAPAHGQQQPTLAHGQQ